MASPRERLNHVPTGPRHSVSPVGQQRRPKVENRVLESAIAYLRRGWSIIPLKPSAKEPLPGFSWREFQSRKASEAEARAWFTSTPDANLGIVTGGVSDLLVVDIDGDDAAVALAEMCGPLPQTPTSITGKGRHCLFRHSEGIKNRVGIITRLDVRSEGGYIVAPPSLHPNGSHYRWSDETGCGFECAVAVLPETLKAALGRQKDTKAKDPNSERHLQLSAVDPSGVIAVGVRNTTLTQYAGRYFGQDFSSEDVLAELLRINATRCAQPLDEEDVVQIVDSIGARHRRKQPGAAKKTPPKLVVRCMDAVEPEDVRWLWQDHIPLGGITVWDGAPGVGKSTLTLDLAARVSTGSNMPDGTPCAAGGVLLLNAEDPAPTVRKRLDAAGADTSNIHVVDEVTLGGDTSRMVRIPEDINRLAEMVRSGNVRLLIIDPLVAFFDSSINSWSDQGVRSALAPLTKMAIEEDLAVLVVRHPTKNRDNGPMEAGSGSIGIVATARAAFYIAMDPEEPDQVVIAPVKQNLSERVSSQGFKLVPARNGVARIHWLGTTQYSAADLRPRDEAQPSKLADARTFLREVLKAGPTSESDIRTAAVAAGIAQKTLQRAKREESIESHKESFGGGWKWSLPSAAPSYTSAVTTFDVDSHEYHGGQEATKKVNSTIHPATSLW